MQEEDLPGIIAPMKRLFAVASLLALVVAFSAQAQQRILLDSDPIYEELRTLLVEERLAVPSTSGPFTVAELALMLKRLDAGTLSRAQMRSRDWILEQLSRRALYGEEGGLVIDAAPRLVVESYFHSNTNNPEWISTYEARRPVLSLPLSMSIASSFYALMQLDVRKEPIILSEDPSYLLNLPASFGEVDYQFPRRAFLSVGGPHWNVQFGRDAASWGNGVTGNFLLSNALEYHDYLRATTFWRNFKYHAMFINLESWNPDTIKRQSDLYRSYLLHRIEARLFGVLNLAVTEGISLEGKYQELRYFNPFMIFHNWFLNDKYGNIIFGLEGELTVFDGLFVYGQYVLDQRTSKFERDRYGAGAEPDSLGYLAGVSGRFPIGDGHLYANVEGVLTTPWLYIISGQPDFTEERKRITNYLGRKYLESKPLGYVYGPDTMLVNARLGYRIAGLMDARIEFQYQVRGENDLGTPHARGPDAVAMKTPSGETPEHRTFLRVSAAATPAAWFEVGGEIGWLRDVNDDHRPGAVVDDLQVVLRVGVTY